MLLDSYSSLWVRGLPEAAATAEAADESSVQVSRESAVPAPARPLLQRPWWRLFGLGAGPQTA